MENPFEKRAHEHLRDVETFLSIVSPDPIGYYLEEAGKNGNLYDRLVTMLGTPGSGKTTLAKLFEFGSLHSVTRRRDNLYRSLAKSLHACGALLDERPTVLGCRLPMESDYRASWEFPYPDQLKFGLMAALVQARAVLGWLRSLERAGFSLADVEVVPRPEEAGAIDTIGGATAVGLLERAQRVEEAIYSAVNSLIPPPADELPEEATAAYKPFDVIDIIRVKGVGDLRPLVVFDDVHNLHPDQYEHFSRWLVRRELKISRWMLARLDALSGNSLFDLLYRSDQPGVELPGITTFRDVEVIWLQGENRHTDRKEFRRLARDISDRYIQQMPVFRDRGIKSLTTLLETERRALSTSDTERLRARVISTAESLRIPDSTMREIQAAAEEAVAARGGGQDLCHAVALIAAHSWSKRQPQRTLFDQEDVLSTKPRALNADVIRGAALHLHHEFGLPFYFTFDVLADASSGNIEQFLRLASVLIQDAMTKVIRGRPSVTINSQTQDRLLKERATGIVGDWNFPRYRDVRNLLDRLAAILVQRALEPNAPLGSGPNAYGIEQSEFERGLVEVPNLRDVLRFGHAYNAFSLTPHYPCKNKEWFLIELGGIPCVKYGLALQRGNFVEGTLDALSKILDGES